MLFSAVKLGARIDVTKLRPPVPLSLEANAISDGGIGPRGNRRESRDIRIERKHPIYLDDNVRNPKKLRR